MSKHTELPWETEGNASDAPDPRWQIFNEDIILAVTCGGNDRANAEFIVASANSYKELLDMIKDFAARIRDSEEWWMECPDRGGFDLDAIEVLIAKAEATP